MFQIFNAESFPTMTIINMLDDYGYKAPTDLSSANSSQQRAREDRKSHTRPDLIHSLNLRNLSRCVWTLIICHFPNWLSICLFLVLEQWQ